MNSLSGTNRPNILVVDDVIDICEMIHTYLTTFIDVNVVTCLDGMSALTHFRTKEFALLILDIDLPKMDGFQLAREMTNIRLDDTPPIIYITGHVHDANRLATGYEIGAVDYIIKPFNMEFLLSKVKVFLKLYEQRISLKQELAKKEKLIEIPQTNTDNFRSLFNSSQECICYLDINGKILNINKAGLRLFKTIEETPLLGVHFSHWVIRPEKQRFYQSFSEVLSGKYSYNIIKIQNTNNDIRWLEVSLSPQRNNNELIGVIMLAIDVTDNRKSLESLNNELSKKMNELAKVKTKLEKRIHKDKERKELLKKRAIKVKAKSLKNKATSKAKKDSIKQPTKVFKVVKQKSKSPIITDLASLKKIKKIKSK